MGNRKQQDAGQIMVISGPSGVGKGTLCRELLTRLDGVVPSISATTRPRSPQEVDGQDYYFMTREEFEEQLRQGAFLEHAEVFGNYYGTPRDQVQQAVDQGLTMLLEIDVQGGRQVKAAFPEARMVFIMPPSPRALKERLAGRGRDDEAAMQKRLQEAAQEIAAGWQYYEYMVTNDDLEQAVQQIVDIIQSKPGCEGEN